MSFFKGLPVWANPQASENEENERDLFSHSDKFLDIQKDTIEQKKKRAELLKQKEQECELRKKHKDGRKESKNAIKRESPGEDSKGVVKKRRINSEESAKLLALYGMKPITIDSDDDENTPEVVSLPVRRSPRGQKTKDVFPSPRKPRNSLRSRSRSRADIGDDSDRDRQITTAKLKKPAPPPEPAEEEDSDPEIAAIKRRAREKHEQTLRLEISSTPNRKDPEDNAEAGPSRIGLPTPPLLDPTISLLITSDLPGTVEVLVKRKLSQDLRLVKEAWCQRQLAQGCGPDLIDKVFFTWNGRRLYNVTTCQRLGIEVDSQGNVVRAGQREKDGAAKVHIIAMTEELYAQSKADKERNAKANSGLHGEDEEEQEEAESAVEQPPAEQQQIRLYIKAKGRKDVRVIVTPVGESRTRFVATTANTRQTTMVSKVLNYAKRQLGIPDDQPAYLQFDGEHLDSDEPISSTELEDSDGVDLLLGE